MRIGDLIVEAGREDHIARHYLTVPEVEQVAFGRPVTYRVRHDRFGLIGQTEAGRYLMVIAARRQGAIYSPVTASDAEDSELRLFRRAYRRP